MMVNARIFDLHRPQLENLAVGKDYDGKTVLGLADSKTSMGNAIFNEPPGWQNMSSREAVNIINKNRDYFDTAYSGKGAAANADRTIAMSDLAAVANDKNAPMELRQAAARLYYDETSRNVLNGGAKGGDAIGFNEMDANASKIPGDSSKVPQLPPGDAEFFKKAHAASSENSSQAVLPNSSILDKIKELLGGERKNPAESTGQSQKAVAPPGTSILDKIRELLGGERKNPTESTGQPEQPASNAQPNKGGIKGMMQMMMMMMQMMMQMIGLGSNSTAGSSNTTGTGTDTGTGKV